MTVDIRIGKLIPNLNPDIGGHTVDWPDIQLMADGSKLKYNSTAGYPRRSCSYTGFEGWLNYDPAFRMIYEIMQPNEWLVDGNHCAYIFVSDTVLALAKKLHHSPFNPLNADRSRWLEFWLLEARQTFGRDAVIGFS